jgi:hypothetical protein
LDKKMKPILLIALMLYSIGAKAWCDYPDERSMPQKPRWFNGVLPPNGTTYYYTTGEGKGNTYEQAFMNARKNIAEKQDLATGQYIPIGDSTSVIKGNPTITAQVVHDYWERCLDPELHKRIYSIRILCLVARHVNNDLSAVVTPQIYLQP